MIGEGSKGQKRKERIKSIYSDRFFQEITYYKNH